MNNADMQSLMNDIIDVSKELLSLRDENRELKSENAELRAELEQEKEEIDKLKLENGALEIAFDSCLKSSDIPSIKANAIRDAVSETRDASEMYYRSGLIEFCTVDDLNAYADELERGEL